MSIFWLLSLVSATAAGVLGVVVASRSWRHPAHVSFGILMLLVGGQAVFTSLAWHSADIAARLYWAHWFFTIGSAIAPVAVLFSLTYARSDENEALNRWLPLTASWAALLFAGALVFEDLVLVPQLISLQRLPSRLSVDWVGYLITLSDILGAVFAMTNLERTFRGSIGVMRWRIKYMVLGMGVLFVYRIYASSQVMLHSSLDINGQPTGAVALLLACGIIGFALTRAKIFTFDVYPSRTVLSRSLTVLLAGVYLLTVGLLTREIPIFSGDFGRPLQALVVLVALVGLAVALLSERFRRQMHQFVSRHFQRPVYDYRLVWSTFTAQTASRVDETSYCRAAVAWTADTFRVLSVNLWLTDETRDQLRFGGSTSLTEVQGAQMEAETSEWLPVLNGLASHPNGVDIDDSTVEWVKSLRRLNPGFFPTGGHRICLLLTSGGERVGILMLGDRVSGLPYTTEDLDLLKCVGDQLGAGLLSLRLSKRLLRAKEFEAFQAMSAFFVHDLKNTASTLSLTLQNLREHFGNPEFRDDAIRAVGKSVQRLDDLIARLSQLRQELHIHPVQADLAATVRQSIAQAGPLQGRQLSSELADLPLVRFDPDQLQKVLLNLILNARDAVSPTGEIHVTLSQIPGWAVLAVRDNGCGMSPEFLRRSLFRPFQTTKKHGLGIGMFQSKMIVDAHGGRMEVDSKPGEGTTFRVMLPLN